MKRLGRLQRQAVLSLSLIAVFSLLAVAVAKWETLATAALDSASLANSSTTSTVSDAQSYVAPLDLGPDQTHREYQDVGTVLNWASGRKLELFDLTTGQVKGSFDLSDVNYPIAVTRQSASEVLLSVRPSNNGQGTHTLFVLDVDNSLAVKRQIPLYERLDYALYSTSMMVISNNERYLYYPTWDGHVAALDLDSPDGKTIFSSPGRNCQYPALRAVGPEAVVATCHTSGEVKVIDPSGKIVPQRQFTDVERGNYTDVPAQRNLSVAISFSAVLPSGQLGGLLKTGSLLYQEANGSLKSVKVTPDARVALGQNYQLDGERLLVGYSDYGKMEPQGFVVFNLSTMQVEQDVKLGVDAIYLSHNRPSTAMVLKDGGIVEMIDLNTNAKRSVPTFVDTSVGDRDVVLVP